MKIVIAGSGAVAVATAKELCRQNHQVDLISSDMLGSPYLPDKIPGIPSTHILKDPSIMPSLIKGSDAVFCCGSKQMLERLLSRLLQNKTSSRIFFLTSWNNTLTILRQEIGTEAIHVVPCYPKFACELVDGELIQVGPYQLEVSNDWLSPTEGTEVEELFSSMGLKHKLYRMETRFKAHFQRTRFAYWLLRRTEQELNDPKTKPVIESRWKIMDTHCLEHRDLQTPLQMLLLSIMLAKNAREQKAGLGRIISSLLDEKSYKVDAFLKA